MPKIKFLLGTSPAQIEFNPNLVCKDWTDLNNVSSNCQACSLCLTRTQVVNGRFNIKNQFNPNHGLSPSTHLLIIGEAPGRVEDEQGYAFVGDSGRLLDIMLDSVGINSYFVTNIVRCRPPHNRNPTQNEIKSCQNFLESEIALVKPRAILCLGKSATKAIVGSGGKFERLMLTQHKFYEYPVWVAYHPAYLLRQPSLEEHSPKWQVWQVLCRVRIYLDELENNG
ncbi:MAG: uracil-DNA glycosylase [Cyanobacteria bacterium J06621_8]